MTLLIWHILFQLISETRIWTLSEKKVRERSRECHNHKLQPFPDPKRKRKPTNLNKHKPNKCTKSTKISSLFPKRGNRYTKRTEKHKNKMTHGKTYNKSPRRVNHKATNSKTNTGTTALERSVDQTTRQVCSFILKKHSSHRMKCVFPVSCFGINVNVVIPLVYQLSAITDMNDSVRHIYPIFWSGNFMFQLWLATFVHWYQMQISKGCVEVESLKVFGNKWMIHMRLGSQMCKPDRGQHMI